MKTFNEVKEFVKISDDYKFLKDLKNDILIEVFGGSLSYGTERYDPVTKELLSDIDIRGIMFSPKEALLGNKTFEQKIDAKTDTVIYSLNKFASLAAGCNPNVIEMLDPCDRNTLYRSSLGQKLIDNRFLFFSKVAIKSFGGYASAQIDRLTNAIARDSMTQSELEEHIKHSLDRMIDSIEYRYGELGQKFKIYIDKATERGLEEGLENELFCDAEFKHISLRDYKAFQEDITTTIRNYGKINHRNRKDEDHLGKHCSHTVRLLLTGIQLLEEGDIHTYRPKDLKLLTELRNGKYQLEDGTYDKGFFDMIDELNTKLKNAAEHTQLPAKPDFEAINNLIIELNEEHFYSKK